MAVIKTCEKLKEKICLKGAEYLGCEKEEVEFDGKRVWCPKDGKEITLKEIGNRIMCANEEALMASEAHYSPTSPPPFMVGMAEVEVDLETGKVTPIDYVAVVDCGTVVNPVSYTHLDVYKRQFPVCRSQKTENWLVLSRTGI